MLTVLLLETGIGAPATATAVAPPADATATGRLNRARTFPSEFLKFNVFPLKE